MKRLYHPGQPTCVTTRSSSLGVEEPRSPSTTEDKAGEKARTAVVGFYTLPLFPGRSSVFLCPTNPSNRFAWRKRIPGASGIDKGSSSPASPRYQRLAALVGPHPLLCVVEALFRKRKIILASRFSRSEYLNKLATGI